MPVPSPDGAPDKTFAFFSAVDPELFCIGAASAVFHMVGIRQTGIRMELKILIRSNTVPQGFFCPLPAEPLQGLFSFSL